MVIARGFDNVCNPQHVTLAVTKGLNPPSKVPTLTLITFMHFFFSQICNSS